MTTAVWPTLRYRDTSAAIQFLVLAFGFEKVHVHRGENARSVAHAELRWPGGGGVMISSARGDSPIAEVPPGTGSVYVVVKDPEALLVRAKAAGATVVQGITQEDHGSRGFTVRDPEGVFWSFGTYAGA